MPPLGFTSSSISADSTFLISPSPLALWNLSTGKKVWEQKEYCLGCALSADGQWAIANTEGKLHLINAETGALIRLFDTLHEDLSHVALAISPDKKLALSKTTDGKIRLWDVATGKVVKQFDDPGPGSCHLSFSADSKLASSKHFSAKTWDVATGKLVQTAFENAAQNDNYGWAYSDDGKHCVRSGRNADKLEIWSVSTGKMILQLGPGKSGPKAFIQASFSPNGRLVAAGSVGGLIRIWEVSTGGVVKELVQPFAQPLKVVK
jgi:WD40 repeat protein